MSKLTIEVERDAHDDTYYRVLNGSHILMDRINDREDLMMYLESKIKSMEQNNDKTQQRPTTRWQRKVCKND